MVTGRVRQVVVLYSNDCMGICLGGLSIGFLRRVVIFGGRWNRFDRNIKCYCNNTVYFPLCVFLAELYQRIFTIGLIN